MLIQVKSTTIKSSDFEHEPLPHPITHIRLVEVLPLLNRDDTTIRCRLRNVRLIEYDQCYTALSYAWDHGDATKPVILNGKRVNIKSNLYDFLCIFREKSRLKLLPTVFIWIDALCLDFCNTRERNSQVQIVPSIFAKAKAVLGWLEPSISTAVPAIHQQCKELDTFLKQIDQDLKQVQNAHIDKYLTSKYRPTETSSSCRFSTAWKAFHDLCWHPYWSRLWILQETRFAHNLVFLHHDLLWTWDQFKAPFMLLWYMAEWMKENLSIQDGVNLDQLFHSPAADVVRLRSTFLYPHDTKFSNQYLAAELRYADVATDNWQSNSDKKPLSELLTLYSHRQCSETSDKIYSLVALSDTMLTIDYERTHIELFCAVLLNLRSIPEISFISMLAHRLGVSAFQYQRNRKSLIKDVQSDKRDQSTADIVGKPCRTVLCVRPIPARTEISDIIQARLGTQKLNHYRITAQQDISRMKSWSDFPESSKEPPRLYGYVPGTSMPMVDGFDLTDAKFRAAMFLNPSGRSRKAVFGMVSTDGIEDGDIMVTDEKMHTGLFIRISGLSKTWLTVVGITLFARRVSVESEFTPPVTPTRPMSTNTIRSATLSDFCEHTYPTPFTITKCDDRENFTLRPNDIQLQGLFEGVSLSSGNHTRTNSNMTNSSNVSRSVTVSSKTKKSEKDRRLTSQSDRLERILDVISLHKRRHSK